MLQPPKPEPRRGIMVVWLALTLAAVMGVVMIALDGGRMLGEKQHVQATADAAALAAAGVLYREYPVNAGLDSQGNARDAALKMAAANGISDGTNAVVTVNIPPTSGDFIGKAGYAEVIVSHPLSASFSAVYGYRQLMVSARATARGAQINSPSASGYYVLASTGSRTFVASGSLRLTIVNAALIVNSSSSTAIQTDGGSSITASSFQFVGGGFDPGCLHGPITHPAPPVSDPLAALTPPSFSAHPVRSNSRFNVNGDMTLEPGVYIGGINVSGGTATLQPGVYLMNGGGFNVGGNGAVNGSGVMIYSGGDGAHAPGAIDMAPDTVVTLSPATSGTYVGVTCFQDRLVNQRVSIQANHNKTITGALYAPAAHLYIGGASGDGKMDVVGGPVIGLTSQVQGTFQVNSGVGRSATPQHLYDLVD